MFSNTVSHFFGTGATNAGKTTLLYIMFQFNLKSTT